MTSRIATEQHIQQGKKLSHRAKMSLYDEHFRTVYFSVHRILANQMDAEDITHDAFIQAFNKWQQLEDVTKAGPWLKRIAINLAIKHIKKKKNELDLHPEQAESGTESDEVKVDWQQYNLNHILNGMQKLPDGYRMVLSLYLLEDHSHEEIAHELDISVSSSRSQLTRGKRKLIEILKNYG